MIEVFRERLRAHPGVRADLRVGDVLDLRVDDGSVDLALCTMALHWFAERGRGRRPDGRRPRARRGARGAGARARARPDDGRARPRDGRRAPRTARRRDRVENEVDPARPHRLTSSRPGWSRSTSGPRPAAAASHRPPTPRASRRWRAISGPTSRPTGRPRVIERIRRLLEGLRRRGRPLSLPLRQDLRDRPGAVSGQGLSSRRAPARPRARHSGEGRARAGRSPAPVPAPGHAGRRRSAAARGR